MKQIYVTKHSGEKQLYDRDKVLNSILRSGVRRSKVLEILSTVEDQLYDGITTGKLYHIVAKEIDKKGMGQNSRIYRLREILSQMDSLDFEKFIELFLEKEGYQCQWNVLVEGFCVEHQIDVIAQKGKSAFLVEVKRHRNFHRDSGLGTVTEFWARLEDLQKGFQSGKNKYNFTHAWLITNTKYSEHAKQYASCKDLWLTGWRFSFYGSKIPQKNEGLEKKIQELGIGQVDKMIKTAIK